MAARVEHLMGTTVSFDVRDRRRPDEVTEAIDAAVERLREIEERFSTYRADSEVSRLARGEIAEADCSQELRWVLAACDNLSDLSKGAFDARGHRADGRLDPSGFVKGWAVEEAAWILLDAGLESFSINAGGDVLVRGEPAPGEPWRVGIRHPERADRVAGVIELRNGAVATSGLYERGEHIHDPRTGEAPSDLLSLTVVGPSLTYADAYATAGFAMGLDGPAWVHAQSGYGAYAITADRRVLITPVADQHLAAPEPEALTTPS